MAWKTVAEDTQELKPPPGITYSKYQKDVFEYVGDNLGTGKHLMVQAVAGSGKSFTGVELFKMLPRDVDSTFVAFNSHIAKELKSKLPDGANARTYHSLGLGVLRNNFKQVIVDTDKVRSFLKIEISSTKQWMVGSVSKLVGLCKGYGFVQYTNDELRRIAFNHDIDLYDEYNDQLAGEIFYLTRLALEYSINTPEVVDFDDMIWLPNVLDGLAFHKYDFLFVDEVQDTNTGQMHLAIKSIADNGMIVGVGDFFQSIYAWRGADAQAMTRMKNELDAVELPLSLSYRCPVKIKELVNQEFPNIKFEVPDWAIEGDVKREVSYKAEEQMQPDDMVLCRVNADLIPLAFSLIRKGIKATVRGRDIGKGIVSLIKKSKAYSVDELIRWADNWRISEITKATKLDSQEKVQLIQDKFDTLYALTEDADIVSNVVDRCNELFSDDRVGVTLSSIHRAKGLEADNVFILRPDLLPHPMAKSPEQKQQESNLRYVAVTRAKNSLTWVL